MHRPEINDILEKYVNGTCTTQERELIDLWLLKRGHNEKVLVNVDHDHNLKQNLFAQINALEDLPLHIQDADRRPSFLRVIHRYKNYILPLSAVAALILIFFGLPRHSEIQQANRVVNVQTREVTSAAENPTAFKISTAERDYTIDELPENIELHIGNAYVMKRGDNSLHYRADNQAADELLTYHTVSVPAGKDLNLYLADGSKVWVNTKTVLRFPTSYAGKNRMLYLSGEAFFDVASDKAHPFIVAGKGMQVSATGTQFNVRNYIDEKQRSTTLVEGKVDVDDGNRVAKLSPNQQWLAKQKDTRVRNVDVANVLGSKDGYFVFDKQNIREIMHEVSRWYDIEVNYQGEITDKEFGGTFSRKRSLEELLDYLSSLGGFYMKREGRRITIMS
ncbi:FecR family protein [Sphingobacterium deserti]|uniref:Anti-FecI sigma factor, FecR n=1 Tax=Sphingobacterium deserti TaxID=1229276 RepID=A0A0B8T8X0_9SPHI|nr:FecR family protein [Sphingobacterium deserti]KGE15124.1 anti-FecI sigma factor, FecR [Sphingobacterium deserti]